MTVGELRKALEGVDDEIPVAISDESWYRIPQEAQVKPMCESDGSYLGDYLTPDNYRFYEGTNKPVQPVNVFVIE